MCAVEQGKITSVLREWPFIFMGRNTGSCHGWKKILTRKTSSWAPHPLHKIQMVGTEGKCLFKGWYVNLISCHISLGQPEIFEKVAKIGVGCIFYSYKSPTWLTINILLANNIGYDPLSLDTVFFIHLKNDHCAYEKTCAWTYKKTKQKTNKKRFWSQFFPPFFPSFFFFFSFPFSPFSAHLLHPAI